MAVLTDRTIKGNLSPVFSIVFKRMLRSHQALATNSAFMLADQRADQESKGLRAFLWRELL